MATKAPPRLTRTKIKEGRYLCDRAKNALFEIVAVLAWPTRREHDQANIAIRDIRTPDATPQWCTLQELQGLEIIVTENGS